VLAGVHDHLVVALAQPARDGCCLHELRPITYDRDYAHRGRRRMFLVTALRGGLSAARGALRAAAGAGSHAAWWLDHNLASSPRPAGDPARTRRDAPAR
jgi:hypothetical protein